MELDWIDIPGYDGAYQINRQGQIRTWRWRKDHYAAHPRLLIPYKHQSGKKGHKRTQLYVKLTRPDGVAKMVPVIKLVVDTFLGGRPDGMVSYHKNGDLTDNAVHNIGFTTPEKLGAMTGAKARRRPVLKIDTALEIVEIYHSARQAGVANHMSYQTVIDRCNHKMKRSEIAPDGFIYAWDDDRHLEKTLRRAMAELDAKGIPYNDPHTSEYYNLEMDTDGESGDPSEWMEAPTLSELGGESV